MKIENDKVVEQASKRDRAYGKATFHTSFDATVQRKEDEFHRGVRSKEAGYGNPEGHGSAIQNLEQEFEQEMNASARKDQMAMLAQTMSPEDFKKMQEDGFSAGDMDADAIVTVTDKIKVQLAKAGVDTSYMGDDLSAEQLEKVGENISAAVTLARKMQGADIPVTEDNLEEGVKSISQGEELQPLNEGAVKYLLDNNMSPTLENIYIAEHCGSDAYTESYAKDQEQQIDFEAIKPQIEEVISGAGYPVNEQTIADSTWMIENEIPFTSDNFAYMQKLKEMSLPLSENDMADAVVLALTEGKSSSSAMLIPEYSLTHQAKQAVEIVSEATDQDLEYLISNGQEITIENLKYVIEERKAGRLEDVLPLTTMEYTLKSDGSMGVAQGVLEEASAREMALISAKRQLEETRLAMTVEANLALLKKGISIDTKSLEEVVEQLKLQEENYYKTLLGESASAESIGLFEDTNQKVSDLKAIPAYVLGMREYSLETVNEIHEAGAVLKDTFEKANESYEILMTAPRSDLGDSIQKAFSNVDDILVDLGMEESPANERAVRMLAYNSLDINPESIAEMKAADERVQRLFSNMTPSTVKELIEKGINPLDMNLDELNHVAEQIRLEQGEADEKFSEYLWKLDQSGEISREERDSYIGIYRLMHQIEVSDGAAIGAIVSQGAEFTMRNLLTAVRSAKKGNMDYSVDDEFAGVDGTRGDNKSITEQIDAAYQQNCVKDIMEDLTPSAWKQLVQNPEWENLTPEQLKAELEKITSQKSVEQEVQDRDYVRNQLEDFTVAAASDKQIYQLLSEHGLPNSVNYVLAANRLVNQRNRVFNQLFNADDTFSNGEVDFDAVKEQVLEQFTDAMGAPEAMAEAYKELADTAENVMKTMIADKEHITNMDIREMKLMCTQVSIAGKMAGEENYAIPVLMGGEVTNVSLKIVRGKEQKGYVDVMFESPLTGKVAASFELKENEITGSAATDNAKTKEFLEQHAEELQEQMQSSTGETNIHMGIIYAEDLNLEQYAQKVQKNRSSLEKPKEKSEIQTKSLYGIARSFIEGVKELTKNSDI